MNSAMRAVTIFLVFVTGLVFVAGCERSDTQESSAAGKKLTSVASDSVPELRALVSDLVESYEDALSRAGLERVEVDPSNLGGKSYIEITRNLCRYLPAAVMLIRNKESSINSDRVLVFAMWGLSVRDQVTIWMPAVLDAYRDGAVRKDELVQALFLPKDIRADFYMAYKDEPIRSFYSALIGEKRISDLPFNGDVTVGRRTEEFLSGKDAREVMWLYEHNQLDEIQQLDLDASCYR